MKNILMIIMGLFVFAAACTDPELDPFQFDKIKQGSLISLRGDAVKILNNPDNRGAVDTFSISADPATQSFDIQVDFLAEDPNSLSEVQIYALATETGTRTRVATVAGSTFAVAAGSPNPRATISIPLSTILSAIGKSLSDFSVDDYIFIEADLTLKDGSTIPASSFSNLSLYESALFYPAHKLRLIAKP